MLGVRRRDHPPDGRVPGSWQADQAPLAGDPRRCLRHRPRRGAQPAVPDQHHPHRRVRCSGDLPGRRPAQGQGAEATEPPGSVRSLVATPADRSQSMTEAQWRTHRLELDDQTLREWDAVVLDSGADGIVLDRSAFYPGGGGQPPDEGVLLWGGVQTRIVGARKGDDLYLIPAEGEPLPPVGTAVHGALDDARRSALMRTHSGLHVLCGVVFRDYGALVTGGNMEPLVARMDFDLPDLPDGFRDAVEEACNAEVRADRR